ncbi:hypothetical protein SAMN05444349_11762 [Bacteroides faecichinchillae]|uniref:PDZ domain-containing protein n=1 Tax=Bacteroides faecichinchillae TaxID=871325 RepID=A0A1M5B4I9_9BACE|nr:hypothetical protein [Bacteroides faecichinchillae]SHF37247.1 hypothetical protein SAMN05444349_11762 [Bacteroides faecichinchillae]
MYDFWNDNYEWLLSGIVPTLITAIFGLIKYKKNKRNKNVPQEKIIQTNTIYANNNSGHIINNNHQNINIGDTKNTAERRYKNAVEIVKDELLDNYLNLCVLINGIEERVPQKFWDVRKPNESEDTFQERARNFHKEYQTGVFQLIQTFKLKEEIYNISKHDLSFNSNHANCIKNIYYWQKDVYDTLNSFSSSLSHYLSLNFRDYELYLKNKSLYEDKVLTSKISLLQSIREFIHIYPGEEDCLFIHISELGFAHITAGMDINIKNLNIELNELYTKRSDILKKDIPTPLRTLEIERIIRDPYLILLRKSVGLTEELTTAEYNALLNKETQTEVTDPQKLISLAIASYTESDGRGAIYYYRKALDCIELPLNIKVFIEQSLLRLMNPDIYEGGIGLIILEIQDNSVLFDRLSIGDVIYKINGKILLEPSDISSTMACTSKEDNMLLDVFTKKQKRLSISLPGRTHLECIVSQSVMLNSFFI